MSWRPMSLMNQDSVGLAKVEVASSSLVSRSNELHTKPLWFLKNHKGFFSGSV
jgi:hypothetical protein